MAFALHLAAAADLERAALIDLALATNVSGWAPPPRGRSRHSPHVMATAPQKSSRPFRCGSALATHLRRADLFPAQARHRGWLSSDSVCAWQLVGCDEEQRVKSLSLDYTNLRGTLPASLGALSRLEALDLEGNFLSGTVPSQLGSLASLVQLGLGGTNRLSGALPATLCAPLGRIVGAGLPGAKLSCDLGGDARWLCPLPCAAVAARCGARCDAAAAAAAVAR